MFDCFALFPVLNDLEDAVARAQRGFHRVGQPIAVLLVDHQAIDHHRDVMVFVPIERGGLA